MRSLDPSLSAWLSIGVAWLVVLGPVAPAMGPAAGPAFAPAAGAPPAVATAAARPAAGAMPLALPAARDGGPPALSGCDCYRLFAACLFAATTNLAHCLSRASSPFQQTLCHVKYELDLLLCAQQSATCELTCQA